MGQERKFKVGDVVRPAPNKGWSHSLMDKFLTVINTNEYWVTVKWHKYDNKLLNGLGEFNLDSSDFVLAEEVLVDRILTKYGC